MLGNAMMFLLRGMPVVYYGDEQGFVGHGIDQASRQDMFASQVASYNDQKLLGTNDTTAVPNFDTRHPLYEQIAELATLRQQRRVSSWPPDRSCVRCRSRGCSRCRGFGSDGREILIAFNTSPAPMVAQVEVEITARNSTRGWVNVQPKPAPRVACKSSFRPSATWFVWVTCPRKSCRNR